MAKAAKEIEQDKLWLIGNIIKALRIKAGYTSYENFATEHELTNSYYWLAEKGTNLSINYLLRILEIHKVSLSDFFKDIK